MIMTSIFLFSILNFSCLWFCIRYINCKFDVFKKFCLNVYLFLNLIHELENYCAQFCQLNYDHFIDDVVLQMHFHRYIKCIYSTRCFEHILLIASKGLGTNSKDLLVLNQWSCISPTMKQFECQLKTFKWMF